MSTGVVILIVLLAMAIGGAIVLMLTRGRRGGARAAWSGTSRGPSA